MAKKDKPAKGKSKTKVEGKGKGGDGGAAETKKKTDKVATVKDVQKRLSEQQDDNADRINTSNKPGSFSSVSGKDEGGQRASKVVSLPEWDSEAVQSANLISDVFSCSLVLVMEDSPDLSKYGEYLLRAVETGVRRKFTCISGAQTAERVKRFLASHGQGQDDLSHMERQDLFAEAIKHTLLGIKETVSTEIDADQQTKEMELAGARSKDLIRYIPPVTITGMSSTQAIEGDTPSNAWEPPPVPPPTEQSAVQSAQKKTPPAKQTTKKTAPAPAAAPVPEPATTETEEAKQNKQGSMSNQKIGVKTRMRKRGEVPMPEFELIDDSPPKGPRSYVLLQGFYNPQLIEELRKVGVKVDGILLMTDAQVTRYNFSIIDVEDSIPGTFKPRNVLPQYLKAMERLSQNPETRNSEVTQFWSKLSDMYNTAAVDSPFHDIALMNFPLPDPKRINLESNDGITFYASKIYDEVTKRVYEMLVLEGWFHEFSSATDVTKLQPLEPALPHDIYDQIVGQIPSECISVPIILEAVVQQVAYSLEKEAGNPVPEPCYGEDDTAGITTGKSSFGTTNWGLPTDKTKIVQDEGTKGNNSPAQPTLEKNPNSRSNSFASSLFKVPMYIKAGDYASIRSCHLNESLASKIASCQLSGDLRNIQGFLWKKVPEFNRGLYMKLLGNLNHFMFFMPPEMIQFEDMFYILHLLMSAGVEVHLQKTADNLGRKSKLETLDAPESSNNNMLQNDGVYYQNRPESTTKFPGTNLSTDRNYLAVSEKTGLHFVITPNSQHDLTVASFGHSQNTNTAVETNTKNILENFSKQAEQKTPIHSETDEVSDASHTEKRRKKKSKSKKHIGELDVNKAARVTAVGAIHSAAKHAKNLKDSAEKTETELLDKRKKRKGKKGKEKEEEVIITEPDVKKLNDEEVAKSEGKRNSGGWSESGKKKSANDGETGTGMASIDSQNIGILGDLANEALGEKKTGFASVNHPAKDTKRFIACEEQWFEDIHDTSVIQALLECPALLAINESGALDLSNWIEKYLLSAGMEVGPGEGVLLGDLKNWNYVEELVPIQTVQMLNECSQEYLSMQRMYCPFYDTILFIFNNPMPKELTSESKFYFRLKTLPGLQHFLEYTMDDQSVLRWIEQLDSGKRLEVGEQSSINVLLNIIPEDQWLMVPSIKYQLMVENQRTMSGQFNSGSTGNKFYGQIENYSRVPGLPIENSQPSRGSTKSFVPSTGDFAEETTNNPLTMQRSTTDVSVDQTMPEKQQEIGEESKLKEGDPTTSQSEKGSVRTANTAKTAKSEKQSAGGKTDKKSEVSQAEKNVAADMPATTAPTESGLEESSSTPEVRGQESEKIPSEVDFMKQNLDFVCYDLGKRVAVVGNDMFFLFPMDGTVIRYDISTIEPEFRMMQLTVTKNGHQTFFYPYYIPHDFDLSAEDYVVCPYFHMVLANGTIFAFQDLRSEEAAPYLKIAMNKRQQQNQLFSFEKILFGKEVEKKLNEIKTGSAENGEDEDLRGGSAGSHESGASKQSEGKRKRSSYNSREGGVMGGNATQAYRRKEDDAHSQGKKKGKGLKEKKSKKLHEKSPEPPAPTDKKKEKKGKKDKKGKGKAEADIAEQDEREDVPAVLTPSTTGGEFPGEEGYISKGEESEIGNTDMTTTEGTEEMPAPPPTSEIEGGDWMYPSSENSDDETETQKRKLFFAPPWDDAVKLIQPMLHAFNVTLPSGLMATVEDLPGPPLLRIVKQHYVGHGSAKSNIEGSRYYTMDGSVIKFLLNGKIQVLTARGVTTNIDDLAANSKREGDVSSAFGTASVVKIFNGEVILPNGNLWQVVNGKRVSRPPIYVFTTGPLAGGEVFRRRQDGVVYLHRYDGTVITHYPDGTRFTTRMVILEKNNPPEPPQAAKSGEINAENEENVNDNIKGPNVNSRDVNVNIGDKNINSWNANIDNGDANVNTGDVKHNSVDASNVNIADANINSGDANNAKLPVDELQAEDDEFSDWVFVGLKYMIEHPNYSTVLFNTLSGNVHLKMPHGEWVRIFADGSIRISTEDQYCMDVDKNRALLSYPPCSKGRHALPNLTAIRLWHAAPPQLPSTQSVAANMQVPIEDDAGELPAATVETDRRDSQPQEQEDAKDSPPTKKRSKNIHHSKSVHPKVKQRENKKSKATRISQVNLKKVPSGTAAPGGRKSEKRISTPRNERHRKLSYGDKDAPGSAAENENPLQEQQSSAQMQPSAPENRKPSLREEGDSPLTEFLKFRDETTFCKSVDSWDNRFLMNVYGGTVVDKMEKQEENKEMSTQQLIETLSEHSQLPKDYISGILKNTSSENLDTAARRVQAIRRSYNESCTGGLPNTKIFVVKRDLTAFQFLQKSQVNEMVTKAYSSRESMVIVDPVPKRQPRKFITIMRPVEEMNEPHGMWTRPYIEPIFRPRGVTNKHLRVSSPNDLRWFGYILNMAHGKRPRFVPEPKEVYKSKKSLEQSKMEMLTSLDSTMVMIGEDGIPASGAPSAIYADMGSIKSIAQNVGALVKGDSEEEEELEGYSGEEEVTSGEEEEDQLKKKSALGMGSVMDDDKKKKKKEKKEDKKEKDGGKKGKGKKGKGAKESQLNTSDEEEEEIDLNNVEGSDMSIDSKTGRPSETSDKSRGSARMRTKINLRTIEPEIGEYPNNIEDVKGIYDLEHERRAANFPRIVAKEHSLPCNTKKAVVVRAFVEIPQIDEDMQRALLAASMSYAETCRTETAIFKTYKTEDPRSAEEKRKQTEYKQQMIEENIDEMHLMEQKPGPVLTFHF